MRVSNKLLAYTFCDRPSTPITSSEPTMPHSVWRTNRQSGRRHLISSKLLQSIILHRSYWRSTVVLHQLLNLRNRKLHLKARRLYNLNSSESEVAHHHLLPISNVLVKTRILSRANRLLLNRVPIEVLHRTRSHPHIRSPHKIRQGLLNLRPTHSPPRRNTHRTA